MKADRVLLSAFLMRNGQQTYWLLLNRHLKNTALRRLPENQQETGRISVYDPLF